MAITRYAGDRFYGLDEEKASLLTKVLDGAYYIALDTEKQFVKKDGAWLEIGGSINGSGISGYLPAWTDQDTLGNSSIYQSGANIGINTINPEHALHISGDVQISGYLYDYTNSTGLDGYVLTSRSGGPVWEEIQAGGGTISGSGVSGYVARWDGETNLTSGVIYDNGTSVGIGTTTLAEALTVNGRVEAEEFIGDLRGAVVFKANAGENISKGQAVYISGISGNKTVVSLADADDASKMPAFGVAAETASANSDITIVTFGRINNLDTSAYTEGDELFVSTTAGVLTDTPPAGESALLQKLAKVTRSDNSAGSMTVMGAGRTNAVPNLNEGRIFVGDSGNQAVADGTVYVDIANSKVGINTTSPQHNLHVSGSAIISGYLYDSTNSTGTAGYVLTSEAGGPQWQMIEDVLSGVGGSGTANYIPKWNDPDTLGNSSIYEDSNGNIGINNITPSGHLDIGGVLNNPPVLRLTNKTSSVSLGDTLGEIQFFNSDDTDNTPGVFGIIRGVAHASGGEGSIQILTDMPSEGTPPTNVTAHFNANGKVGIGTAVPLEKLEIQQNSNYQLKLTNASTGGGNVRIAYADNSFGSGGSKVVFDLDNGGSANAEFVIQSDGKVGIGATTPLTDLDVRNNIGVYGANSSTSGQIYLGSSDFTNSGYFNSAPGIGAIISTGDSQTNGLGFYTYTGASNSRTEKMRIEDDGKVGIGTTSPEGNLHIFSGSAGTVTASSVADELVIEGSGDSGLTILSPDNKESNIFLGGPGLSYGGLLRWKHSDLKLTLGTNVSNSFIVFRTDTGLERVRIDANGNVGVGTTGPSALLHINRDDVTRTDVILENDDSAANAEIAAIQYKALDNGSASQLYAQIVGLIDDPTAGTEKGRIAFETADAGGVSARMTIDGSRVGIGTVNPDSKFHVVNNDFILFENTIASANSLLKLKTASRTWQMSVREADLSGSLTFRNETAGTDDLIINTAGSIGVGQPNPAHKLHVNGDAIISGYLYDYNNTTGEAGYVLTSEAGGPQWKQIEDVLSGVGGSGTANYVPLWQDEDTLTDSVIAQSGNYIGIGSDTPAAKLHVQDDSGLKVHATTPTDDAHYIRLRHNNSTGTIDANRGDLNLDAQNYVYTLKNFGINATTPSNKLVVINSDTDTTPTALLQNSSTGDASLHFNVSGRSYTIGIDNSDDDKFKIARNNGLGTTDRLTINGDGNIGIGTTNPTSLLHLRNPNADSDVGIKIGNDVRDWNLKVMGSVSDSFQIFTHDDSNVFTILSDGKVGINTTTPTSLLHVHDGDILISNGDLQFYPDSSGAGSQFDYYAGKLFIGNQAGSSWHMVIQDDGNIGVGTTSPTSTLNIYDGTSGSSVLKVDGTNGTLFEVVDDLSGSLMSVNDAAGLPVLEVFADSHIVAGRYGQNDFYLDTNGNLGLGTATPITQLHISSASTSVLTIQNTTNVGEASLNFRDETNANAFRVFYDLPNNKAWNYVNGNGLTIYSTQTNLEIARFGYGTGYNDSYFNGNVGVNTSVAPAATLQVNASSGWYADNGSKPTIKLSYAGTVYGSMFIDSNWGFRIKNPGAAGALALETSGGDVVLRPNTTSVVTVNSSGSVGINESNPVHSLHVDGDAIISGYLYDSTNSTGVAGYVLASQAGGPQWQSIEDVLSGVGGGGTTNYIPKWDDPDTLGDSVIAQSGVNIGIGKADPTARLDVKENIIVRDTDSDLEHIQLFSNSTEGVMRLRNGANWGFIARGISNSPYIGAYSGGSLHVAGFTNANGSTYNSALTSFDFANQRVGINNGSPVAKLDIRGDLIVDVTNNTYGGVRIHDDSSADYNVYLDMGRDQGNTQFHIRRGGRTAGTNTWASGSDVAVFSTAKSWIPNGNVGIGTDSPATKLHVEASVTDNSSAEITRIQGTSSLTTTNTHLRFTSATSASNATNRWFGLQVYDHNPTTRALALQHSGGNVGIGTTSPQSSLHILGSTANNLRLERDATNDWQFLLTSGALVIQDATALTERLRIDSGGRLGVGITPITSNIGPAQANIQGHGIAVTRSTNDAYSNKLFFLKDRSTNYSNTIVQASDSLGEIIWAGADGVDYATWGASIEAVVDGTPGANDLPTRLVFSTTADGSYLPTERMRITSAGSVGIGTTGPTHRLTLGDISSTPTTGRELVFYRQSSDISTGYDSTLAIYSKQNSFGTYEGAHFRARGFKFQRHDGSQEYLSINNDGNVGVGTADGDYKLHVVGDAQITSELIIGIHDSRILPVGSTAIGFENAQCMMGRMYRVSTTAGALHMSQYSTGATADSYPAYSFYGDGDTGIALYGTNKLSLTTGGATRLLLDDNGSIDLPSYGSGNNTGTVAQKLAVDSSGNVIETDEEKYLTSTGGTIDTGFTADEFRMLEVVGHVNPNSAGSALYRDPVHIYVYNGVGWNGSAVTNYVYSTQIAPIAREAFTSGSSASGNIIEAVFLTGSTESDSCPNSSASSYQVRLKISNYNTDSYFQVKVIKRF